VFFPFDNQEESLQTARSIIPTSRITEKIIPKVISFHLPKKLIFLKFVTVVNDVLIAFTSDSVKSISFNFLLLKMRFILLPIFVVKNGNIEINAHKSIKPNENNEYKIKLTPKSAFPRIPKYKKHAPIIIEIA
jgi:hypothetical protein